ncbi:MAG TPA: hypothetical protein VM557_01070 [Thermoanaerobaculia bacterium]|nr:hypothetical protein [Thermoanaerobaculia bacterium]
MKTGLAAVTAVLLMAGAALAAEDVIVDVRNERILVPVAFQGEVAGAHGSIWRMELTGYNDAGVHVKVALHGTCAILCPPPPAGGKSSFTLGMPSPGFGFGDADGIFYYVERPHNREVHFSLRTRDLSRQASTWGTEIPVVREHDIPEGPVHLVDVPLLDGFRLTLRIYDLGPELNRTSEVVVRAFDRATDQLLFQSAVPISMRGFPSTGLPTQVRLDDFGAQFGGFRGRARIEVHPAGNATRIWAFISITHNETQHVTLVTPQ